MAGSEAVAPDGSVNSSLCALVKDGPVLSMFNKRLRALKKKYNRILQIEESKAQGKTINKEQEDVLKSKVSVSSLIDEFEKLKQPLSLAVKEEIAEREKELLEEKENGNKECKDGDNEHESENENENRTLHIEESREVETNQVNAAPVLSDEDIEEILKILYFGQLFNVVSQREFASIMWTKMHERSSCLSYDFVTDDTTKPLREEDLDSLAQFGSLVTSRPANETLSHKSALENCVHHARQWLLNSDQPIHPDRSESYSELKERLNRILSSEYFTMTPELQTVSQQTAAAAATAAGQYVTQVLVHENSAEGHIFQTEAATVYHQTEDQSGEEQLYQPEEYNGTALAAGAGDQLDSGVEVSPSVVYVAQNENSETSFEGSKEASTNQISANLNPAIEQHESQKEPLISQSDVPEQKQQLAVPQGYQQLEMELELEPKTHQQQPEHERRENQQQTQPYSQNGGSSRGYQGQRGGRGMGYGGGRARAYTNGRGGRSGRGGGFSNGRGQYYNQGNYYRRSGGGRGRKSGEMMYNNHAAGPPQDAVAAQAN